ncbi:hypothetical protein D3C87_1905550 [compost metagenome]
MLFPSSIFFLSLVLYVRISGKTIPPKGNKSPIKEDKLINFALSIFGISLVGMSFSGFVSKTFASAFNVYPFGIFPASIR